MTFPITKTADHTVSVGDLMSTTVASSYLFPTYLVTSDGTAIGAANAIHVQPGTGATWAITVASLPLPSGAATSGNQVTELASLASIDGKTPALGQALAAASVPVVLTAAQLSTLTPLATVAATQSGTWNVGLTGTVALPTGASTEAKQDTGNSSLSSLDGKTPALGQALAAASVPVVLTASQLSTLTPPAAISGFATSAKQDTGNVSLASIDGKITAVNTGAVVVSSSALPSGAATAAKQPAIGTAGTPSSDVVSIQGVASGTVVPISDGGVSLTVDNAGTFAVQAVCTNAGTFLVQAAQSGTWTVGLSAAQTLDTVTTVGTVTTVSTVTNLSQLGGVAIAMGTGARSTGTQRVTIATDDVVPASQSGTWTVGLSAGTNGIGKLTANAGVTIGAVEIAAAQTLATVTTVGTVTTCSTVTTVSTLTGGGVAHDGADSGNPHKIGAKAVAGVSGQTKVAAGDRTDLLAGVDGLLVIQLNCSKEDIVSGVAAITDGSNTSVIAQQGIGIKTYITDIIIANTSATAVTVDIRDGVGGSVKATFPAPANTGGVVHSFKTPIPFTAGTEVCADPSAAVSTVTVTLVGFKSKV